MQPITHVKISDKISAWKADLEQSRLIIKQHPQDDQFRQSIHHIQVMNAMKSEEVLSYFVEEIRDSSPPDELAEVIEKSKKIFIKAIKAEKKETAKLLKSIKKEIAPIGMTKDRISLEKIWFTFHWTNLTSIIEKHPDCAKFLKESGLLFAIRGYQHSIERRGEMLRGEENMKTGIKLDRDGHPLLLKEGEWTRWELIKKELRFDKENKEIVSTGDASIEWNYFYPYGLVPGSRYNEIKQIYRLSGKEMESLKQHAASYFEINPDTDPGVEKNCFIQVYTTARKSNLLDMHAAVRLIDQEGRVYSMGYEMPMEHQNRIISGSARTFLATGVVTISTLDYDEFRPFDDRYVTTVPISAEKAKKVLEQMKEYTHLPLRFNFIRQNCARFALEALRLAGVENIDPKIDISGIFARLILPANLFNMLQKGIEKISAFAFVAFGIMHTYAPNMADAVATAYTVIAFVPRKIGTVARNILICILGGRRAATPLPPNVEDDRDNKQQLKAFSRVMVHWKDLWSEDLGTVYYPPKITEWQQKQHSTIKHAYEASPALYVAPHQLPQAAVEA